MILIFSLFLNLTILFWVNFEKNSTVKEWIRKTKILAKNKSNIKKYSDFKKQSLKKYEENVLNPLKIVMEKELSGFNINEIQLCAKKLKLKKRQVFLSRWSSWWNSTLRIYTKFKR